ncbi:hypothetical protein [Nocardia concava]|uniref:hypothetical protein n=1 Tax=Nocardia concava TaxID=257281 RepID=UPI0005946431|nr:hypothetical protein [Nocardia concava]
MTSQTIGWVQLAVVFAALLLRLFAMGWVFVLFAAFSFGTLPVLAFGPLILTGFFGGQCTHPAVLAADGFLLLSASTFPDTTDVEGEVLVPLLAIIRWDAHLDDSGPTAKILFILGYLGILGYLASLLAAWLC